MRCLWVVCQIVTMCHSECEINTNLLEGSLEFGSSEYSPEVGKETATVIGRLKEHATFWRKLLNALESILSVVESGYVTSKTSPSPIIQKNHRSAILHADFVVDSIVEFSTSGCIKEVDVVPHICSPLSAVQNSSGKKRLVHVVNLRYLNTCRSKSLNMKTCV